MPIIGNPIYQSAFVTDQFTGNGSTTAFTMSVAPAGVSNVLVAVSGVLQDPSTYSVVGNTLTFTAAPPSGTGNISCRYLGVPASGVTTTAYRTVTEFTATASQTTFTPPSYTVGFINVYLNGVLLGSADYTASNGTTVVLATGASAGNLLTVESFLVSSVLNAIPNTAGSVGDSNIVAVSASKLTGSQTIPKATLPTGCILQVIQTTSSTIFSSSSTSFVTPTGLSATITPLFSTSKVLITARVSTSGSRAGVLTLYSQLVRNSTALDGSFPATSASPDIAFVLERFVNYLDSPATTSATTYSIQFRGDGAGWYVNANATGGNNSLTTITLMEIAA